MMSDPERTYLRRIRNTAKRAYGYAYSNWCDRGASREDEPSPECPGIGGMAAQAVRLSINAFRAEPAARI
jgi:hypothetical protein